jgi:hypothetical protein
MVALSGLGSKVFPEGAAGDPDFLAGTDILETDFGTLPRRGLLEFV